MLKHEIDEDTFHVAMIGDELHIYQTHSGEGARSHLTYSGAQSAAFALRGIARRLMSRVIVYEAWASRMMMSNTISDITESPSSGDAVDPSASDSGKPTTRV